MTDPDLLVALTPVVPSNYSSAGVALDPYPELGALDADFRARLPVMLAMPFHSRPTAHVLTCGGDR